MRLDSCVEDAIRAEGLPVPNSDRVDRIGWTDAERKALRKHHVSHDTTRDADWEVNSNGQHS